MKDKIKEAVERAKQKKITPEEFEEKMKKIKELYADDIQAMHRKADALLYFTLKQLGYEEGIKIFDKMEKWYA